MSAVARVVIGAVAGALVGAAMYKFVGCRTGACPLTGNLYISMFIWALIGVMAAGGK
ncbi:MAG: YtxH domain-containing protein [Kiritimatiellia bacterium]